MDSVVVGGKQNTALEQSTTVTGGKRNSANGRSTEAFLVLPSLPPPSSPSRSVPFPSSLSCPFPSPFSPFFSPFPLSLPLTPLLPFPSFPFPFPSPLPSPALSPSPFYYPCLPTPSFSLSPCSSPPAPPPPPPPSSSPSPSLSCPSPPLSPPSSIHQHGCCLYLSSVRRFRQRGHSELRSGQLRRPADVHRDGREAEQGGGPRQHRHGRSRQPRREPFLGRWRRRPEPGEAEPPLLLPPADTWSSSPVRSTRRGPATMRFSLLSLLSHPWTCCPLAGWSNLRPRMHHSRRRLLQLCASQLRHGRWRREQHCLRVQQHGGRGTPEPRPQGTLT